VTADFGPAGASRSDLAKFKRSSAKARRTLVTTGTRWWASPCTWTRQGLRSQLRELAFRARRRRGQPYLAKDGWYNDELVGTIAVGASSGACAGCCPGPATCRFPKPVRSTTRASLNVLPPILRGGRDRVPEMRSRRRRGGARTEVLSDLDQAGHTSFVSGWPLKPATGARLESVPSRRPTEASG